MSGSLRSLFLGSLCALSGTLSACDAPFLDFSFTYSDYRTEHFWNKDGKRKKAHNDFKKQEYELYADWYFSDIDCLQVQGSYIRIEESMNGNTYGFSDPELTWSHCFYKDGPQTLSSQLTLIAPSGGQKHELRYGRFGGEVGLLYSTFFNYFSRDFFFDGTLGYRIYHGFPSDQIRNYMALGTYLFPRFYLEASTDLQYGVYNGKRQIHHPVILFDANYRLLTAQIRGVLTVWRNFYLAGGYFSHVWGRNVGAGGGWFAEAWLEF